MSAPSAVVAALRRSFRSGRTHSLDYREGQLRQLEKMLTECKDQLFDAVWKDIRRGKEEAHIYELVVTINEVKGAIAEFRDWCKPQKVKRHLLQVMDSAWIAKDPLGVVLIIAPWNYPILLSLLPVAGAIAAGNCVLIKPSEVAPNTAQVLSEIIPKYMDPDCVRVVLGGVPETQSLLQEKFDHIFYTGSPGVAKVIMEAASKHLTPVTLELGGKSPVFLDDNLPDADVAAKRIAWAKFMSAGQTCLAPDYILVTEKSKPDLIRSLSKHVETFYGKNAQVAKDYSRIINQRHFERVNKLLTGTNGQVVYGGRVDKDDLYIEPTIIDNVKPDDVIMQEEIFGPLLPIITVKNMNEAIDFVNDREKALAIYIFSGNNETIDRILNNTTCGGVTVNDCIIHIALDTLPFGGVGQSGMGRYHGKFSFDTFTHEKAVLKRPFGGEFLLGIRYPPFTEAKYKSAQRLLGRKQLPKCFEWLTYLPMLLLGLFLGFVLNGGRTGG